MEEVPDKERQPEFYMETTRTIRIISILEGIVFFSDIAGHGFEEEDYPVVDYESDLQTAMSTTSRVYPSTDDLHTMQIPELRHQTSTVARQHKHKRHRHRHRHRLAPAATVQQHSNIGRRRYCSSFVPVIVASASSLSSSTTGVVVDNVGVYKVN
uniref:Uncharacterized protein n=1 Tax=Oryza sativa subsp. japonica TaxID=39947 RepID=Q7XI27_ORYSJ|nr:hypothetical protein [Oryza sativa Japonica Group]BAD30188.1 hypothetical protein [Oryza sativa Japonica Group]